MKRLPVQHPNHPHCPKCGDDLPNFDNVLMMFPPEITCEILSVTFSVRCDCGTQWDLKKTIDGSD